MGFLDIILCILLILGLIKGIRNGFFVELASLVSMLLGFFIASKFSGLMQTYLEKNGYTGKSIESMAFALTFVAVIILSSLFARFFTKLADFAYLGWINKLLGAVFGVLKTLLLISVILNLFHKTNGDSRLVPNEMLDKSKLYVPIREVSKIIYPSISEWFANFKLEAVETPEKQSP